ncbi:MAG: hypothetical protein QOK02_5383 [Mycobacterium sp.]|jgi:hypothetical protein|nr:hypothetical protein [Mycobacterium sp.]
MQRIWATVIVACSSVMLAVAGPARAEGNDQQYLDLLKANNLACGQTAFECPLGDASMIAVGHQICTQLKANSKRSIASLITKNRPGVQPEQAITLVLAAETAYCPKD